MIREQLKHLFRYGARLSRVSRFSSIRSSPPSVNSRGLPFVLPPLSSMRFFSNSPSLGDRRTFFESKSLILNPKTGTQNRIIATCKEGQYKPGSATALLTINVGEQVHEEAYLAATCELLLKLRFSDLIILPVDLIQRWTLKIKNPDMSNDDLEKLSQKKGDEWLVRNSAFFAEIGLSFKIIRWINLMSNSDFEKISKRIRQELKTDKAFLEDFNTSINKYIVSVKGKGELKIKESEARNLCLEYLIESATAYVIVQHSLSGRLDPSRSDYWILQRSLSRSDCVVELNPKTRIQALTATLQKFFPLVKNLDFLRINFESQPCPQPKALDKSAYAP